MAINNHERIGKAMELLKEGLAPFVDRELKNVFNDRSATAAGRYVDEDRNLARRPLSGWDVAGLLRLI